MTHEISNGQLAAAAALLAFNLLLSLRLRLGLERKLLIAAARMTVQLLLVGLILGWLFQLRSAPLVLGIGLVMTLLAGQAAVSRAGYRYHDVYFHTFLAIFGSSYFITGLTLTGVLNITPWFDPQYAIPILGMVLGNAITGISLALGQFLGDLDEQRGLIETRLSLGANAWEAAHPSVRRAMTTCMVPTLNAMAVMGLVTLPGMVTGQILGGAPPQTAVRYQIVIMFVIASATALGSLTAILLAFRSAFDAQGRLRHGHLQRSSKVKP